MTKENHDKLISCQAVHSKSDTSLPTSKVKLNIPFAPDILQATADRDYYHVSESAVLQCQIVSNPAAVIIWRHIQTQRVLTASNDGSLIIKILNKNISGDYECIAENKLGRVSSNPVHIQLAHAPNITPNDEHNKSFICGEVIKLHCEVEAVPEASYRWLHKKRSGKVHLTDCRTDRF